MNIQTPISASGVVPINDVAPVGWKPNVVLIFVIDFIVTDAGHLHFGYSFKEKAQFSDLNEALDRARATGASLTWETPLDIDVNDKALVFVGLAKNRNWEFSPRSDGASLKQPIGGYGKLLHVFDNTTIPGGRPMTSGCKMICFSAFSPPTLDTNVPDYCHGMNFHVDIIQPDAREDGSVVEKRLPLIIDPDIRHPGGNQA
ncbi:nucleotide synthetase [Sphingomonas sp. BK481]|jgi:hypothetical protein|uniref:nucleotide synthetase n=1 Tax=Sphingomonas sp. BK481 TaxID=2586981 RepID=UPI001620CA67|nr:nucleotide synthetase [Sphingomonas sp. BK481]MBB3587742.1 hypothetical protein [Sphingomonas sp. BK481]